jgi:hypothetical protein
MYDQSIMKQVNVVAQQSSQFACDNFVVQDGLIVVGADVFRKVTQRAIFPIYGFRKGGGV